MSEQSPDLPLIERNAVRLVVLDMTERVLLLHTRDLGNPDFGTAWELPGGGLEAGETHIEAAVRELREETGLTITPDCVGKATWRRNVAYTYRGARRLQHEIVVAVRLRRETPLVEGSHGTDIEREDHFGFRWWTVDEIARSTQRFYPGRLPKILPDFLAGKVIDEPFEWWR